MVAEKQRNRISLKLLQPALLASLRKGYQHVRVDPEKYLRHIQRAHRLPIRAWSDMILLGPEVVDPIAEGTIASAARVAALEGMGFGMGGMLTILPDMGVLSTITIRLLQKLSLLYGFEYATDEQVAELWIAAASAAGLDLGREFIEKQAIEKLVPRIIDRIAVRVSTEIAEKWSGRIIPVLSAGIGGTLNYCFVRVWGRRAQRHLLARHNSVRTNATIVLAPNSNRLLPTSTP
jgi:hypothetical protein